MWDAFSLYFNSSGFMPHGHCFLWTPSLLWSYVVSDLVIAASYYSIPFALWYFACKRHDLPFRWGFIMFGLFVMACGTTHVFAVWNIWHADYWPDAAIKAFTAAISAITAILLWYWMPQAIAIPTRQELHNEIERRRHVEEELNKVNRQLELRIAQRTSELTYKNSVLTTLHETSPDAMLMVDANARILSYNRQFVTAFHIPEELARAAEEIPILQIATGQMKNPEEFFARIDYLYAHRAEKSLDELQLKDGRIINRYSSPVIGEDNQYYGRVWHFRDITELKRSEQALQKVTRALKALSNCNSVLVHASEEGELLQGICDVIVDVAGYRLAWVGFAEYDANKTVRPVARAGYKEGYWERASITWADNEQGGGPAGIAVRTQKPCVIQDAKTDPQYELWHSNAVSIGYGSVAAFPLVSSSQVLGALCIYSDGDKGFETEEIHLLNELAEDLAFGIVTLRAQKSEAQSALRLTQSMEDTIFSIAALVEMRDPYTAGHQTRVAELSVAIAHEMGLAKNEVHGIRLAAAIHDLGKIQVPAEILSKPSRLSDIEFALVKEHPKAGYDILNNIDFPWPIAQMVYQHHERIDGSGYPQGLKETEILIGAKILAVADVVEAMASHRPYRPGLGIDKAIKELLMHRGKYYDPCVVDACEKLFREGQFKL
ncbi:MAG: HD domain-containing phosphohydrolase [Georgfuchsia sp.]